MSNPSDAPVPVPDPPAPSEKIVYINFFSKIDDVSANKFMTAVAEIIKLENPTCIYRSFLAR